MPDPIQMEVVTYADEALKVNIKELYIPAFNGQAGILQNHKPYISLLKSGEMAYTDGDDKKFHLYIRGGVIEVIDNKVSVICDSMEWIDAVNKKEIEDKLAELDKKIKALGKIEAGLSQDEILKVPDELAKALEEQKEFQIKRKIIRDIEAKSRPFLRKE
ncbi:MAG: ATP synthase F1 subunit epsilon [Candidatus Aminicenantes bacterium]|nr:ATP synthase F1 subunit epsilon [Candidatus Aminicenantes bacterium]